MFILEGNIGAGKSTFLSLIQKHFPSLSIKQEQVNDWEQRVYGQSLLTNFYENPKRWAYTFEALTAVCRVQEHIYEQRKNNLCIMERSLYSGFYCFAYNSYKQGFLTGLEWQMYQEWFTFLVESTCKPPLGFIYLRVSPEIAYERVQKRKRSAEKTVPFSYIKQIHDRHESLLISREHGPSQLREVPVLIIDGNEEFEENKDKLREHFDLFMQFYDRASSTIASL